MNIFSGKIKVQFLIQTDNLIVFSLHFQKPKIWDSLEEKTVAKTQLFLPVL